MRYSKGHTPWIKGKNHTKEAKDKNRQAHLGKKHSAGTKEKMRKAHKGKKHSWHSPSEFKKGDPHNEGKNHPNWKGGITPLKKRIRNCLRYKQWQIKVFERDNFTCQFCNKRGTFLIAHHIKGFAKILRENNIKTIKQALNCKELWDLKNGITLCKECHKLIHKSYK